jgi:hypothetical protein
MQTQSTQQRDFGYLLFGAALLFGAIVRFYPVAVAGFPLNDGGLFYRFTQEIQANHFALPPFSAYNQMRLPLAYPPLAFYLTGALQSLTHIPLIELIRWLPPLFSWLGIGAFYLLARRLEPDALVCGLGALIYALLPRVYEWDIMGGGITRALGGLLALLLLAQTVTFLRKPTAANSVAVILLGSALFISHPDRALHACLAVGLMWWFLGQTRASLLRMIAAGAVILLLTAPWWGTLLRTHGITPFLGTFGVSGSRLFFGQSLLMLNFFDEGIPVIVGLVVVGVITALLARNWYFPTWILTAFILDPRNAGANLSAPLALLAATAWIKVILPGWRQFIHADEGEDLIFSARGRWIHSYLILLLFLSASIQSLHLASVTVSIAERAGLNWIHQNTARDSRFVLFTWHDHPIVSPVIEWFPALAERANLTTIQGREWLTGEAHFTPVLNFSVGLQTCIYQDQACVAEKVAARGETFDYIWLSLGDPPRQSSLSQALQGAPGYELVYQNAEVLIYRRAAE